MAWQPTFFDGAEAAYHRFRDSTAISYRGGGTLPVRSAAWSWKSDNSFLFSGAPDTSFLRLPLGTEDGGFLKSVNHNGIDWLCFHAYFPTLPPSQLNWYQVGVSGSTWTQFYMATDGQIGISVSGGAIEWSGTPISAATPYLMSIYHDRGQPPRVIVRHALTKQTIIDHSDSTNVAGSSGHQMELGIRNSMTYEWYADNIVVSSEAYAGSGNAGDAYDELGIFFAVRALYADGAGSYQGQASGTFADVDESPADYATSQVRINSGNVMTSTFGAPTGDEKSIKATLTWHLGSNISSSANAYMKGRLRISATDYDDGSGITLPTSHAWLDGSNLRLTNPNTAASWTPSDLAAIEFGSIISGRDSNVTAQYVEYLSEIAAGAGNRMILMMSEAWDRWRERASGLLVPRGFEEPVWKPKPQVLTPTARQVKALAA